MAILCGGASRRMGTDKALLRLIPGGPPLLATVIDRVRPLADELFLVGPPRPGYDQFDAAIVADDYPDIGPLGGIATALRHATHPTCLVVACDMPFLSRPLLAHMASYPRAEFDLLLPLVPADPHDPAAPLLPQPLHAIYRRSCLAVVAARIAAGERRATGFHGDVRVQVLSAAEARTRDPNLWSFVSINTPAALHDARAWSAGSPSDR